MFSCPCGENVGNLYSKSLQEEGKRGRSLGAKNEV